MNRIPKHSFNSAFAVRVRRIVATIQRGSTMTYGEVAQRAGHPRAARAVGRIMSHNVDKNIPCHRVVRADGAVGDYNRGGAARKMKLLREEGAR